MKPFSDKARLAAMQAEWDAGERHHVIVDYLEFREIVIAKLGQPTECWHEERIEAIERMWLETNSFGAEYEPDELNALIEAVK